MILSRKLTTLENELLEKFCITSQWKQVISSQLKNADVYKTDCISSVFFRFSVNEILCTLNTAWRVPMEILFGHVQVPEDRIVGYINAIPAIISGPVEVDDNSSFGVRLHFDGGVITEMEIYSLHGNKLELTCGLSKHYVYIVNDTHFLDDNMIM